MSPSAAQGGVAEPHRRGTAAQGPRGTDPGLPSGPAAPRPPRTEAAGTSPGRPSMPRGGFRSASTILARRSFSEPRLGLVGAFVFGLAVAALVLVCKALLANWIAEPGYILLVLGALLAAWMGGTLAGLVAMLVSLVFDLWFVVQPAAELGQADEAWALRAILFLVAMPPAVVLVGSRRRARDRLADALAGSANLSGELAQRDARLEWVLAASGTGFWEWDLATGDASWSDEVYRQHGFDPSVRPPGQAAYLAMLEPADAARLEEAVRAAIDGADIFEVEYPFRTPDGEVRWMHSTGRVTRDARGRASDIAATSTDVSQRHLIADQRDRLLEEERRAGAFREAFIDVISHELRTPITAIMGLTQLLSRRGLPDDAATRAALLEDVRVETERLHRLVEDLLILSRAERGKLEVELEPLEIRRLLQRVVVHEAGELPSLRLELDAPAGLPIVAGDATYVEQVLRNLLNNAAKYTPPGTRCVVRATEEPDGVAVRVEDEGPGIAEGTEERIFELFYRSPDMARKVSGSGIGLFVCTSLVEAMGGRMWARRRGGGGAEFGFLLRTLEADD
jgi:K+-sensing histidine kinase KdpD